MTDPFNNPDRLPDITWAPPDKPCEICGKPTPLLVDSRRIHALGCDP